MVSKLGRQPLEAQKDIENRISASVTKRLVRCRKGRNTMPTLVDHSRLREKWRTPPGCEVEAAK